MIYLDHHATTPCDPEIASAMLPWLTEHFGNSHSNHAVGRIAADAIDQARVSIADSLGVPDSSVVLTSGATESNNLAIRGICHHPRQKKRHIVSVATEHPAVLDVLEDLRRDGFRVTLVQPNSISSDDPGQVDLNELADAIDDGTALVSVMWANNEIGTVAPIESISKLCHEKGVLLHTDATQVLGRVPIDLIARDVDLASFSAHKCYGPKGIGILVVGNGNRRVRLRGQILGGGQQHNLRCGTLPTAMIVAMAETVKRATQNLDADSVPILELRNRLWNQLNDQIDGLSLNGGPLEDQNRRLAGNLNFHVPKIEGEAWMAATPEVAFSTGSACSNTKAEPSHVLIAMGLTESEARQSVRFGIGRGTTIAEIDMATKLLVESFVRLVQGE